MQESDLIDCTVAPGCVVYHGPPNVAGTCSQAAQPGETIRVTRTEATSLRAAGRVLQADGSAVPPASLGPMPPNPN